jgi:uncharacterized protein YfkK (UPF0435 family)
MMRQELEDQIDMIKSKSRVETTEMAAVRKDKL